MAAYTRSELRSYIRAMYAAASTPELRQQWILTRTQQITQSAINNASGKQLQSQSSAGFSATFATGSNNNSRNLMKLYDRLYDFANYTTVSEALAAVPQAITSYIGDSRKIRS